MRNTSIVVIMLTLASLPLSEARGVLERLVADQPGITFESVQTTVRSVIVLYDEVGKVRLSYEAKSTPPKSTTHWLKGNKYRCDVRTETPQAVQERMYITVPGANYQLDVNKKTGVKVPSKGADAGQSMICPTTMLLVFKKQYPDFSKPEGVEEISDEKCDRYAAHYQQELAKGSPISQSITLRIWARQSDGIVVRSEWMITTSDGIGYSHWITDYKNVKRDVVIPESTFEVPSEYNIADGRAPGYRPGGE